MLNSCVMNVIVTTFAARQVKIPAVVPAFSPARCGGASLPEPLTQGPKPSQRLKLQVSRTFYTLKASSGP